MNTRCRALAVFAAACTILAAGYARSAQLPTLEPAVVEVDLSALPPNERAALARIIHAARKLDTLFIRQIWPADNLDPPDRETRIDNPPQH
jgi:hypothetical protein